MNPSVSVIIPVYNVIDYIKQCYDSIKNQSLEDYEVISIDDGSTDGSSKFLDEYSTSDPRFIVIHQSNKGPGAARNRGIECSKGKYIVFMDPDDWYPSTETLKTMVSKIDNSNCAIAGGSLCFYNEKSGCIVTNQVPSAIFEKEEVVDYRNYQYDYFYTRFIYSSKLLKDNNIRFPEIRRYQDVIFFLDAMKKAGKFYSFAEPTYVYRGNNRPASFFSKEKSLDWIKGMGLSLQSSLENHWPRIHHKTLLNFTYDNFLEATNNLRIAFDEDYLREIRNTLDKADIDLLKIVNYKIDKDYVTYGVFYGSFLWTIRHMENDQKTEYIKSVVEHIGIKEFIKCLVYNYINDKTSLVSITNYIPKSLIKRDIKTVGIFNETINVGGVERCISILIPLFQKMGYNIVLITETEPEEDKFILPDDIKREVLPGRYQRNKQDWMNRIDLLSDIIDKHQIDVLHYHSYWKDNVIFDAMCCKLINKIPFILHHHNVFSAMLARNNDIFYNATQLYSFSDIIICMSRVDQLYFRTRGIPSKFITNPVYEPVNNTAEKERHSIMWAGRFVPNHKQPIEMMKIINELAKLIPDVKLYMIGDGDDSVKTELFEYVNNNGLQNNVEFTGFIDNVEDYYDKCQALVLTSCIEGFPMVVAECKSHGLPIVAYDLPYVEMIRDSAGVIRVEQGNYIQAAFELSLVLEDKKLQNKLRDESINSLGKYSIDVLINDWKEVFSYISNNKRKYLSLTSSPDDYQILLETITYHSFLSKRQIQPLKGNEKISIPYKFESDKFDVQTIIKSKTSPVRRDYSGNPVSLTSKGTEMLKNGWSWYFDLPPCNADAVVSLGLGIKCLTQIRANLPTKYHMPFDTLGNYNLDTLIGTFYRGLDGLFKYYSTDESSGTVNITDQDIGVSDQRDFNKGEDYEETLKRVIDREKTYLESITNLLTRGGRCIMLTCNRNKNSELIEFAKNMNSLFPESTIKIISTMNYPELDKEILYREIFQSNNVNVITVAFNDYSKEKWKGNTESWKRLLSRFSKENSELFESINWMRDHQDTISSKKALIDLLKEDGVEKNAKEIVKILIDLSEQHDIESTLELAIIYEEGTIVAKDYEKSIDLIKNAIKYDLPKNEENVIIDVASKIDSKQSFEIIEALWKKGNIHAATKLIELQSNRGFATNKDYVQSIKEQGNDKEKLDVALVLMKTNEQHDVDIAIDILEELSKNNSYAQFELAKLYRDGVFVKEDVEKARNLMVKSSTLNQKASECLKREDLGINPQLFVEKMISRTSLESSIEECIKLAKMGCPEELNYLGSLFRTGTIVEKNLDESIRLLRISVENGSESSELTKALLEQGSEKSIKEAEEIIREYSINTDMKSIYSLGLSYRSGNGVEKDIPKSDAYFDTILKSDNKREKILVAMLYAKTDDPKYVSKSLEALNNLAIDGNKDAQYQLAKLYRDGIGVDIDVGKAEYLMHESAKQGHEGAQKCIASQDLSMDSRLFIQKMLKNKTPKETENYCRTLAEKGYSNPLWCLGKAYYDGKGIAKNPYKAIDLFKELPNSDYITEDILLAMWRTNDPKYYSEIIDMSSALSEKSNGISLGMLGRMYRDGKGVEKNISIATEYMKKATECGVNWASNELMDLLWNTKTPESYNELFTLASKLDEEGNPKASGYVGRAYKKGKGTEKDLSKSIKYLKKSADGGIKWASRELIEALWEASEYEEMVPLAEKLANDNNPVGLKYLSMAYKEGKGVTADLEKSERLLAKYNSVSKKKN